MFCWVEQTEIIWSKLNEVFCFNWLNLMMGFKKEGPVLRKSHSSRILLNKYKYQHLHNNKTLKVNESILDWSNKMTSLGISFKILTNRFLLSKKKRHLCLFLLLLLYSCVLQLVVMMTLKNHRFLLLCGNNFNQLI